jgi:hypothetical protein
VETAHFARLLKGRPERIFFPSGQANPADFPAPPSVKGGNRIAKTSVAGS